MPDHKIDVAEATIIASLRKKIPLEGSNWTYLWKLTVRPGSRVDPHTHSGWTACVHIPVSMQDPPIELVVGEEIIRPEPWQIIVIPPNVEHLVPEWLGESDRHTFALTVNEGDNRQVIKNVVR